MTDQNIDEPDVPIHELERFPAFTNVKAGSIWLEEDTERIEVVLCPACEDMFDVRDFISHWFNFHKE